jgi:WD40 repeat protein
MRNYVAQIVMLGADTGKELYRIEPGVSGGAFALAFSPDGQWLAASLPDRTVAVYEVDGGQKHGALIWPETGSQLA